MSDKSARLALAGGSPVVRSEDHKKWPQIGREERDAVMRVLERGVLSGPFAPEVRALERAWASYVGTKHCLATNSGTAALHIALAASGVGPGDEVITTAYSFVATALSVVQQGATPVFVDIEPETCGIDPARIEAAITPRTKAILPVHIHGTPCRIDEVLAIAKKHGLVVIEDAAQAHGSMFRGKRVGSMGVSGCFSIQSSKNLSAGEGGLFVTDDDALVERASKTRMFGEDVKPSDEKDYRIERALDGNRAYDSITVGWMYRTTELTAAIASAQLGKLDAFNANSRRNAELLGARLAKLPGVHPPIVPADRTSCFHKYRVRFDATKVGINAPPRHVRDALIRALRAEGLDAGLWQSVPVPAQRLFKDRGLGKGNDYPETMRLLDGSIVLFSHTCPIYPQEASLCEAYAQAFEKVWGRLDEVLALAEPAS
jgi:dTDP-4-amino-4,6-dideoxygalactose transaminase